MLVSTAAARRGAGDPVEAPREVGVGRVRLAAQRVEDPGVEARRAPARPSSGIAETSGQVGEVVDAEAERLDAAVPDAERRGSGIGPPAPSTANGPSSGFRSRIGG